MTSESASLSVKSPGVNRELVKKRGTLKGRLTLFVKFLNSFGEGDLSQVQKAELKLRHQVAKSFLSEFNDIQNAIESLLSESAILEELETRESFEDLYFKVMATANRLLDDKDEENGSKCNVSKCKSSNSFVKLPVITLPTFDGSYDQWLEFRDTYLSIIHNSKDLDNIQKFTYLRSSLKGNALQVIKSLEFSSESYDVAWELLQNRFNNNKLLVHNHVKSLFSIPSLNKESPGQVRKLIDTVLKNLRALKSLGEPTEQWDTLIIYLIVSKLDVGIEKEWESYKNTHVNCNISQSKVQLNDLLNFLKNRADMLEMIKVNHPSIKNTHNESNKFTQSYVSTEVKKLPLQKKYTHTCIICKNNHPLYACPQFLSLSIDNRISLLKNKNVCSNCLRAGHSDINCYSGPCRRCNKKHNSLLCKEEYRVSKQEPTVQGSIPAVTLDVLPNSSTSLHVTTCSTSTKHSGEISSHISTHISDQVLLSTALVEIADSDNKYHTARVLLDNGSQHSFITEAFCKKLNIKSLQSTYQITGVGMSIAQTTHSCMINLKSLTSNYIAQINCLILPNICTKLPSLNINTNNIILPENIILADPKYSISSQVDILIGADLFWELLKGETIRLSSGPYLLNTHLGWIISGPIYSNKLQKNSHINCNFTQSIDTQLKKFWELEEISQQKPYLSTEHQACENLFINTTKRVERNRFSVRIPLTESADALGNSYTVAKNRFLSLERKLNKTPLYKELYCEFMREYLDLGHMTRIENYTNPHYFLPHHGVFREDSSTTKLRVVFNASEKTSSGKSFNDIQSPGPVLLNDLFSILLRFRQHKYVVCADIEKMFRQINIQQPQRNLQLILWRENITDPLETYQLNTVTYGTVSAPYLSLRCVKQLGLDCSDKEVSRTILDDIYMDDVITGNNDELQLSRICRKVSDEFSSACFPLRKWISNSPKVLELVVHGETSIKHLSLGENCQSKTLGLGWLNGSDEFNYTSKINTNTSKLSKRFILSTISQIYDPLGLLAPMVMVAKMLLQSLWLCKLGWDDLVPIDIKQKWEFFINSLSSLHKIRVPRHVTCVNPYRIELHIFTDASQKGYGACAYIRTIHNDNITVKLLCAKSRVAPLKPVSIPRLELSGGLLGARLYEQVIKSLRLKFNSVVFWTDSSIVLGWLKMSPHLLKTFVQNRVVEINDITSKSMWLHVNGKENPADLVSRGMELDELRSSNLWWTGPRFLHEKVNNWSYLNSDNDIISKDLPEVKTQSLLVTTANSLRNEGVDLFKFPFYRFSQFNRMHRACAYMFRFLHNIHPKTKDNRISGPLTVSELDKALTWLVNIVQQQSFPVESHALINKKPLKGNRNISGLNLFMDEFNTIRVGGRIEYSNDFSYNKKHPILICSKHHFTVLLFRYEHKQLLHAGPQLLLSHIRDIWWPLRGRNLSKMVVHQCVTCSRVKGKTVQPIMGNLPLERIQVGFPFTNVGVDYAGPLFMLNRKGRGARLEKCYLCIFICFATRALHLELVTSLSSEGYLLALKRFIGRRGKPYQVFSDHGRNFVGAQKEFSNFLSKESQTIINFASENKIIFKFIPPYAPHFGGLWEAGVKSCKYHLKRVIGNANLTYEEFSTVLVQIEAVLNSRPMYPMSTDPNDFNPLTPSHFLIGRPLTSPSCDDVTAKATHQLTRYRRVEQMRQHFWQRWSREYIAELQTRTKWKTSQEDLAQHTLVLIKDDNLPPLKWRLGRILNTFTGQDGVSRVANIRTASGTIQRAFSKVCPLPSAVEDIKTTDGRATSH